MFFASALIETDWIAGTRAKASAGMGSRAAAGAVKQQATNASGQSARMDDIGFFPLDSSGRAVFAGSPV
jgi:hypothetical protein